MDLAVIENNNGGELVKKGGDLALIEGWSNMPYLGMFGGNIEASTRERLTGEQVYDYWANNLLFTETSQFNSETERALLNVSLSSAGLSTIQKAVEKDLKFMSDFAQISVTVSIIGVDKIKIEIKVKQPSEIDGRIPNAYRAFIYIWDLTKSELGDFSILDFNDDFFV